MKCCPRCGDSKPLEAFAKNRARRDGRQGLCRPCMSAAVCASHRKRREHYSRQGAAWARDNPERARAAKKRHRASGKAAATERARYSPVKRASKAKAEASALGNRYVATRIARGAFDWRMVPMVLIELKRAELTLKRELGR